MNIIDLIIPAGDDALKLRGYGDDAVNSLTRLAGLLDCPLVPANTAVKPDVELLSPGVETIDPQTIVYKMRGYRLLWRRQTFVVCRGKNVVYPESYEKVEWRMLIALAHAQAMIDCREIVILHGVLLGEPLPGTLLFGPSGVGKSTTMRRFQDAGGVGLADDMVLIGRHKEQVVTRPLPTWKEFKYAPLLYSTPLHPARRLLCLSRAAAPNEEERIAPIDHDTFLGDLYAAMLLHVKYALELLPEAEARRGARHVWNMAERLTNHFTPRTLFARLDADILKTLESS